MNGSIFITSAFISSMVFSGAVMARGLQSDLEGDMLYGNGLVAASPSEAYHATGPAQNGFEGDLLYSRSRPEPSVPFNGYQRVADDRDSSTDQFYGSQHMRGQGLAGGCPLSQSVC